MKSSIKILFTLLLISISHAAFTQGTKQFYVGDLKVIYKKTPKDVISVRLYVRGGTANYSKEKEGIETLAFNLAINGGTKSMDKVAFKDAAEKVGAKFGAASSLDYGNMNMTCIKPFWNESWALFVDAILNPAMDEKEFILERDKLVTAAKGNESNPDAYLDNLTMETAFEGRNYAKDPTGSEAALSKITLDDVKKYYATTVGLKRSYLVVVGNVDEADLKSKLQSSLLKMPVGTVASKETPMAITKTSITIKDRDIATNYIQGIMNAPMYGTPEGIPMQLAMNILYDRYFVELRTKRSLSYAPAAYYMSSAVTNPYAAIYITTTKPKESLNAMVWIVDSARRDGFTEKELRDKKQTFLTSNFMKLETSEAQSGALGRSEMIGNYQFDDQFTEKVNTANLKEINEVFRKYSNNVKWVYLGKKDQVSEADFPQPKKPEIGNGPH